MKYDIVIPTIPKVVIDYPLPAPSLLKAVLNENGYKCKVLDWNYDLYKRLSDASVFDLKDLSFTNEEDFNKLWDTNIHEIALIWMDELKSLNTEWVGIPLFTPHSILIAIKLMKLIREHLPSIKIVAGGDTIRLISDYKPSVGEYLKNNFLIDHYVIGEGEYALLHLLQGDLNFNGIDGNIPDIVDINSIPIPDYTDLNMDHYNKILPIIGSRGCINNCAFCDVNFYSNIFRQRRAESIYNEMVYLKDKYNPYKFSFADNLINGSLKEFRKLCLLLRGKQIKWTGQMICTSKMIEDDYKNASLAGLRGVSIGIESGSETVRRDINKRFTNETIYKTLYYLSRYNIRITVMLIIGCPTETEEYFQETLDMLSEMKKNKYNIQRINVGGTCGISPQVELYTKYDYTNDEYGWIYKGNDKATRVKRWFRTYEHCLSLGLETDTKHIERMKTYDIK